MLFLQPDSPEARAFRLVAEALHRLADRAQSEQVAVANDRDLFIEDLVHLDPQRLALLEIGLARALRVDGRDLLVLGPARPSRRQVDVVGGIEEVPHARREDVVLLW